MRSPSSPPPLRNASGVCSDTAEPVVSTCSISPRERMTRSPKPACRTAERRCGSSAVSFLAKIEMPCSLCGLNAGTFTGGRPLWVSSGQPALLLPYSETAYDCGATLVSSTKFGRPALVDQAGQSRMCANGLFGRQLTKPPGKKKPLLISLQFRPARRNASTPFTWRFCTGHKRVSQTVPRCGSVRSGWIQVCGSQRFERQSEGQADAERVCMASAAELKRR